VRPPHTSKQRTNLLNNILPGLLVRKTGRKRRDTHKKDFVNISTWPRKGALLSRDPRTNPNSSGSPVLLQLQFVLDCTHQSLRTRRVCVRSKHPHITTSHVLYDTAHTYRRHHTLGVQSTVQPNHMIRFPHLFMYRGHRTHRRTPSCRL